MSTGRQTRRSHDRATAEYDPMKQRYDNAVAKLRNLVAELAEEDRLCRHPSTRKQFSASL